MHTRFESEDPLALGAGKQGPSATGDELMQQLTQQDLLISNSMINLS